MEAGEVKEIIHDINGFSGLITEGHFEAISEWRNPQHRYFKDNHDPAAGDYEPLQRDKRTQIEVKQHAESIVWIHGVQDKADHNEH